MRKMLLMTLFVATLQAQGQTVKEWMQLPPIPVQRPVFGDTRDVDGQTFNDAKLLRMTTHPVETFRPEVGRAESSGLVWSKVSADGEGAVAVQADRSPAVVYSATYAEAPEWVSGNLVFSFDKAAEVCVDGEQKLTNCKADGTIEEQMTLPVRWEPGKHTVIVKSLAAENGSNPLFSAEFVADEPFREVPVRFTLSPKRGKNILDVLNGNLPAAGCTALNEIAILKRDSASMIGIHTSINGKYLTTYQADGLIVATPTGSTAYSLSVGGPVVVPYCHTMAITAVAPHSLNMRPIVICDDWEVRLEVESRSGNFLVSIDGCSESCPEGMSLLIRRASHTVKVVKRAGHVPFGTLRSKMMWGADVR